MNERLWNILVDSFGKILLPGLTMTIPLTVISFTLAMVIAVATALVQFANVRGLKQLARFYIWVIRGTPLLVQLFVVFYGLPSVGIILAPFPSAVIVFSMPHLWDLRAFRSLRFKTMDMLHLPRKFLPEVVAHQIAQGFLHEYRNAVSVAILDDMLHPLALAKDLVLSVPGFRADDVPLRTRTPDMRANLL